ncbi:MAG TPA: hypothetical protein VNZ53_25090 [Steroidobacteraceae bacterium]|nr:hypothetical protein [Steroidobacteraceae bacterium]
MLKLFSFGLTANLVYVISGALKQYFIAAQLPVASVGVYGAWVAQASLLVVLVPFPAYLDVLIKGFSAAPDDHDTRRLLVAGVIRELRVLVLLAAAVLACALAFDLVNGKFHPTAFALLLLLLAQYIGFTADIMLRMRQAHQRFALFMATRNLPSLAVIAVLGLKTPMAIVAAELLSALITGGFAYRSNPMRHPRPASASLSLPTIHREQATLWLARLGQYVNASLLRLVVPFAFGAHDTGLFFFACIAQIPCSLFLSVTTQLFGHALARMRPGEYAAIARIQLWFLAPNALYAVAVALLVPYWPVVIGHVPRLHQYSAVGPLVFAVALYSAVLSSDCTEYLLRSRGLSRILLRYNVSSVLVQVACLEFGVLNQVAIERTITLCAAASCFVLAAFSAYSFKRVLGIPGIDTHVGSH